MDLVSRDGDFAPELDATKIKNFLFGEWRDKFGEYSTISLFPSLSAYFAKRFPKIRLSDESLKNELINELELAPNFASTHRAISQLDRFTFFTAAQVVRLFEALVNNIDVGWIATDADVFEFFVKLKDKAYVVPDKVQEDAAKLLGLDKNSFFSPF